MSAPIPYIKVSRLGSGDDLRGMQFLTCGHELTGRKEECIDVDRNGGLDMQFFTAEGGGYEVAIGGKKLYAVSLINRESQLFTTGNQTNETLKCLRIERKGSNSFHLKLRDMDAYVGIEKFDSGWYLSVCNADNIAEFVW